MLTLQPPSANLASTCNRKVSKQREAFAAAIPADQVKNLLRGIAIALHATRVVGWKNGDKAPKKG